MYWAESGIRRGAQSRLRAGLLVTLTLGVVFLVIQGLEYRTKPFTPATHAYGSLFYLITGLHGAHVLVGLLMIGWTGLRAFAGHFAAGRHDAVTNVGLYWHFVDVVWLSVFTSLYLVPHLG